MQLKTPSAARMLPLAALLALACQHPKESRDERAAQAAQTINVYAASSTRDALTDIVRAFEQEHARVEVAITYAGSQVLRLQIQSGAAAQVFVSADEVHFAVLQRGGFVSASTVFAGNALSLIVPASDAQRVKTLEMLPSAERIVLGTSSVPVGRYALQLFNKADKHFGPGFSRRVFERVVSRESNARLVRAKVELAEADAAIVYRTDAQASPRVVAVPVPSALNVAVKYHAARLQAANASPASDAFFKYLCSASAQRVFAQHGFLPGDC